MMWALPILLHHPKEAVWKKIILICWNLSLAPFLVALLVSCFSFSQVMAFWGIISEWGDSTSNKRNHYCKCGQLETVKHILNILLHPAKQDFFRKISPELNPRIFFLILIRALAIVKFLELSLQLCWWFTWLDQHVKFLLSANLW